MPIIHHKHHRHWFIWVTLLVSLMLDVLPLPGWVIWCRPQWTLLVLIYWTMALPEAIGLGAAFFVGLLLDLVNGTLLGEHAFALIIVSYLMLKLYKLVRVYPLFQQTCIMFVLIFLYQLTIYIIQGSVDHLPPTMLYWLTVFISTLLWPWVFVILRDCRRRFKVK